MLGGRFRCEVPRRFGGYFRNDADHRDFTAIGTAAGKRLTSVATHCLVPIRHQNRTLKFLFTVCSGARSQSIKIQAGTHSQPFGMHACVECSMDNSGSQMQSFPLGHLPITI